MSVSLVVVVTGGRNFADRKLVNTTLDRLLAKHPSLVIWHGAARGADTLAAEWAAKRKVPHVPFPAAWRELGPAAGPQRNKRMAALAAARFREGEKTGVVAFPGGHGTAHMVATAKSLNLPVWEITP